MKYFKSTISWIFMAFAVVVAVTAQCLMFSAEWLGDIADDWAED